MSYRVYALSLLAFLFSWRIVVAQPGNPIKPDLAALVRSAGPNVPNRTLQPVSEKNGIHFDQKPNGGVVWLDGVSFGNGTIEFDLRGKDVLQQCFIGMAFHGVDDTTYDAVYFRPFNFKNADPVRRSHAVQYISHPVHTWEKLRKEQPDRFEQPINPAPDPKAWFHVRVVVQRPTVQVFVDGQQTPSLVVSKLNERTSGKLGLWVGPGLGGDFANLEIKKD
ncbi:family 16 glycoside hydrolase [Larkinella sp. VNQ87]|uniref:family 16 glycoside hydrolase n=1 Tax=Larkinella sp. VNQ87 TaxID=3400921 RepID=UPI003C0D0D6F